MHQKRRAWRVMVGCQLAALIALLGRPSAGQDPLPEGPYTPDVAPASDAGERAIKGFRVAPGLKVELVAAEPMLANPVTFSVDERNRLFVAETFRYHAGVTDIRRHMAWLDDDLAARTVEDRLAMLHKYLGKEVETYGLEHDRIRLVEDRDGDGKADHSTVFADGFNEIVGGIGAGVLAWRGDVWYACIPDLWRLRDTTGDGRADQRRSLQRGYGVHVGYLGHDLHGLRFGPDGRLYFSIGDRGFNVRAGDGRTLTEVDSGTVLRCNPDGSGLELFATGLRNPQELAFDEHGNLFTCDNNSDSGDKARWVYVVEGGDSGWRIGYQFLQSPVSRGPWNAERLWDPEAAKQAAYLVPPLANISDGPSGLTYDPGTGLPARYRRHFFLADFRGTPGQSGIRSFANRPDGASFALVDADQPVWGVLATDVDFGTDGALYLTDWVEKFSTPSKGRIYRIIDPDRAGDPEVEVRRVRKLLAEGMHGRSNAALAGLLGHADQRVRQEAQFALARRGTGTGTGAGAGAEAGASASATLARVAREGPDPLARLHAIWGLGQVGREVSGSGALDPVVALLHDGDAEVRAQAARILGEGRVGPAFEGLLAGLRDESPRVRFFAAIALGKLGRREAVGPILAMLRENSDRDAYLRHAGVMGLAGLGDVAAMLDAADASDGDGSSAVRMGVLLALRRLARPEVARFLHDRDPALVLEAARAINDVPIAGAWPGLAALPIRPGMADPLVRRVLNANFRLGGPAEAAALAAIAARPETPAAIRVEALDALGDWAQPSGRDRVVGLWRPLAPRPAGPAAEALRPVLAGVLSKGPEPVRQAAAAAAGALALRDAAPELVALVNDGRRAAATRIAALRALEQLEAPGLADLAARAVDDRNAGLRTEALRLLAALRPEEAVRRLEVPLADGTVAERQGAFRILGTLASPAADAALSAWLDRLLAGTVAPEVQLELIEAAQRRHDPEVQQKLARYEATRPQGDPLAPYREALAGGNVKAGRQIFFQKADVSCVRCHKVDGQGGEVGPDLSDIGARRDRPYLLEAIVVPSRQIAEGFETRVVATTDGQVHIGVLRSDAGDTLSLMTAEGKPLAIPKADIEEQKRGDSAMPDDLIKMLSKTELRDLVEFLADQKKTADAGKPSGDDLAP
jgi:quinoprotein glucose dehydrogenase